jgi:hypothetical protein
MSLCGFYPNDTFHFKLPHFECGFTLLVPWTCWDSGSLNSWRLNIWRVQCAKQSFSPSRPPPTSKLHLDLDKIPPPTPSRKSSIATAKTLFGALNTSNIQSSTVQRPRIPTFSGDQKGETTFKVWKFEVKCIIREGDYSDVKLPLIHLKFAKV